MELDAVRALPKDDQRVFLLGRIAMETTSMDAALRFVHAALRAEHGIDAYLDSPNFVSTAIKACRTLLNGRADLDDDIRAALKRTLGDAARLYARRNRYIHDQLRTDLMNQEWELAQLTRSVEGEHAVESVSFDDAVALVLDLIAVTYRLRGSALYVLSGGRAGMALGDVEADWAGSATSTH